MHSVLWENQLDPDPLGDKLIECIFVNNLSVLNNDDGTRFDQSSHHAAAGEASLSGVSSVEAPQSEASPKWSTPDVTICGSDWKGKTK